MILQLGVARKPPGGAKAENQLGTQPENLRGSITTVSFLPSWCWVGGGPQKSKLNLCWVKLPRKLLLLPLLFTQRDFGVSVVGHSLVIPYNIVNPQSNLNPMRQHMPSRYRSRSQMLSEFNLFFFVP